MNSDQHGSALRLERVLSARLTVYGASVVTLALGLIFVFVWAPHPWGWEGFDGYDQLAVRLATGGDFPTIDRPWGYAYFLAAFYRLFGHRPVIPIVAQVVLNAAIPLAVFFVAGAWIDRSTSILAAALSGFLSFNTVYASTLASDSLCTVVFMAALVAFMMARRRGATSWGWYAAAGLLTGIAPQLRPNLLLIPLVLAAWTMTERATITERATTTARGTTRRVGQAAVLLAAAAVPFLPWVTRNYRLTRSFVPTTVHGSMQLWYGTLQVGPYLHSRAYNPRRVFEAPVFDYTSLDQVPIEIAAHRKACDRQLSTTTLIYWTDHDATRHRVGGREPRAGLIRFEIPAPRRSAVIYYYFEAAWRSGEESVRDLVQLTPPDGDRAPMVYFVSGDHLGNLDVHGDLLDIFDLINLARHAAWGEPVAFAPRLATEGTEDLETAAAILARPLTRPDSTQRIIVSFDHDAREARLRLVDGSSVVIPRAWRNRITDLSFDGPLALALLRSHVSIASLAAPARAVLDPERACAELEQIAVNDVFYREEPAMMRRYSALAIDNIRRDPWAFVRASLYRAYRVFVIEGSNDRYTTQQFRAGPVVYAVATSVSTVYLLLIVAGIAIAWRRGYPVGLPLVLMAYLPLTLAFGLTNMRYSLSVQPLGLIFIAVAVHAMLEKTELLSASGAEARHRAGR